MLAISYSQHLYEDFFSKYIDDNRPLYYYKSILFVSVFYKDLVLRMFAV